MLKTINDIISLVDYYYDYLQHSSIVFTNRGFPVLSRGMFLDAYPQLIVPFGQRKSSIVVSPKKTLLCLYCADKLIYPRLENVLSDLPVYKKYMGVIMSDLTVTSDMDIEWQKFIMLLNQLFMAILAVNHIPIVFNTRCGSISLISYFSSLPKHIMCASGFLGCKGEEPEHFTFLEKIMTLQPSRLLIYGKHDYVVEEQLDRMGQEFRVYEDFHRLCKEKK